MVDREIRDCVTQHPEVNEYTRDDVQLLLTEIDRLRAQNSTTIEWVDVRERVPEDRRLVLAYTRRMLPIGDRAGYALTQYNRRRRGGGDFDIEAGQWFPVKVLYWAELSAPCSLPVAKGA